MRRGIGVVIVLVCIFVALIFFTVVAYLFHSKNDLNSLFNPGTSPTPVLNNETTNYQTKDPVKKDCQEESCNLASYPDKAIDFDINGLTAISDVITHRTALNGKTITVKGFIIATQQAYVPPVGTSIAARGAKITMADSINIDRDKNLDLPVDLSVNDLSSYKIGKELALKGVISGNKWTVSMRINDATSLEGIKTLIRDCKVLVLSEPFSYPKIANLDLKDGSRVDISTLRTDKEFQDLIESNEKRCGFKIVEFG